MIRKAKCKNNFTQIPNDTLGHEQLSWGAKGLLSYLLSLPDDWVIRRAEVVKHSSESYHVTNKYFKELINAGFIVELEQVKIDGRFGEKGYIVYPFSVHDEHCKIYLHDSGSKEPSAKISDSVN